MTAFAQRHAITDICFLVEDIEKASSFYVGCMGFKPRRRAPGFADFSGAGVTLALWEIAHISENTGVSGRKAPAGVHKACAAIELSSPAAVDHAYEELKAAGVAFQGPPQDYGWNARCCYFADPDDNLWELYAWADGGPVGDID
ncbi:VOC family protein [Martelella endophytica]|uniref:Lactoylglutathione lyase n=1 Tax=Martelella endophytica TaxID=1486262 RepID=A0A0D5LTU1_MAREN|nr:VOC family protein [Martelella endophytica]AJY46793.1 lactoylglutathione lyase [Martelella endophytica]